MQSSPEVCHAVRPLCGCLSYYPSIALKSIAQRDRQQQDQTHATQRGTAYILSKQYASSFPSHVTLQPFSKPPASGPLRLSCGWRVRIVCAAETPWRGQAAATAAVWSAADLPRLCAVPGIWCTGLRSIPSPHQAQDCQSGSSRSTVISSETFPSLASATSETPSTPSAPADPEARCSCFPVHSWRIRKTALP